MEKFLINEFFKESDEFDVTGLPQTTVEPLHTHEFIEIVYILDGSGLHSIDGNEYEVKKGNLLLINIGQTHSFIPKPTINYVNILLKPEFFENSSLLSDSLLQMLSLFVYQDETGIYKTKPLVEFSGVDLIETEQIAHTILNEFKKKKTDYILIIHLNIELLIAKAIRWLKENREKEDELDFESIASEVIEFIGHAYSEKLSLAELSKKYFYNPSYFSRALKKHCGKSFSELVHDKRIEKATELLRETDMSIEEIAYHVGYNDKKNFYNLFKDILGETPNKYRCKHKDKPQPK